jgi:hypothetical protein
MPISGSKKVGSGNSFPGFRQVRHTDAGHPTKMVYSTTGVVSSDSPTADDLGMTYTSDYDPNTNAHP